MYSSTEVCNSNIPKFLVYREIDERGDCHDLCTTKCHSKPLTFNLEQGPNQSHGQCTWPPIDSTFFANHHASSLSQKFFQSPALYAVAISSPRQSCCELCPHPELASVAKQQLMTYLLFILFFLFHHGSAQQTHFPAAIPLAVCLPYLSCWDQTTNGTTLGTLWPTTSSQSQVCCLPFARRGNHNHCISDTRVVCPCVH